MFQNRLIAELASVLLIFASSTQGNTLAFGPNDRCDTNLYSCSATRQHVCCSPDNGKMILALSWLERKGPADKWTIHGLWPNTCQDKETPTGGCDARRIYTTSKISEYVSQVPGLKDRLNAAWISNTDSNSEFWRDEFKKHGTCISTYHYDCNPGNGPGDDAIKYFKKTLDLYDNANIYQELKDQRILPGANYTRKQFQDAAKKTSFKFKIMCDRYNRLEEIQIAYKVKGVDTFEYDHINIGGRCQDPIMYPAKRLPGNHRSNSAPALNFVSVRPTQDNRRISAPAGGLPVPTINPSSGFSWASVAGTSSATNSGNGNRQQTRKH